MIFWEKQNKIKALYEMYSGPVRAKYGLTRMEYSVLLFLSRNPSYDTASAIVEARQFAKSHVSSAVNTLEEKGLITREHRDSNNKTIHLKLTGQAEPILREAEDAAERYKNCLIKGFSEEELLQMSDYFEKICRNAEEELLN